MTLEQLAPDPLAPIGDVAEPNPPAGPPTGPPAGLPRILWPDASASPRTLTDHIRRHGPPPRFVDAHARSRLVDEVERAGLLGRGGAAFPTARKLRAVAGERRRAIVIANGTEGEPASGKDKALLLHAPHLVLDGAAVAAEVVGADRVLIVVPDLTFEVVHAAITERASAGLDPVPVHAVRAARGFVAGEASAVVRWVEGGTPLPRMTPPRLAERGVQSRPTLVQNVETLAHLALIARCGATWFRAVGPPEEPGSMLVTLLGSLERPGVYEVAIGTRLCDLITLGGGRLSNLGAVLVGGYSGSWVGATESQSLRLSKSSLRSVGATPGAGVVAALSRSRCGLAETARLTRYMAGESAGQCGPCLYGLDAIAAELHLMASIGGGDVALIRRWLDQVDGRGACGHPDGVVRLVRSSLRVFASEVVEHRRGRCCGTSDLPVLPTPGARQR